MTRATTTVATTTATMVATTTEMATTKNSNASLHAGRSHPQAAGVLVARLFAEHGRMVLGLCRLLLRDPIEAEDAAQQVFLSVHRAVLAGVVPRDAHPWLAAIARNECRARIHSRMREPLALQEVASDLPDPLAAAIRAVDIDAIWAAIGSLPRRQRRALVLREVGGLSYHELGRALGVSQSSVESLLFRARRQVRSLVAATVPLALRDDLARLIPGFDPGSAGLAARVAALPVGLKLATAAVSVGVVTTGAAQIPDHHAHATSRARAAPPVIRVSRPDPVRPARTVLVADRRGPSRHGSDTHAEERHEGDRIRETEHQHRGREARDTSKDEPLVEPEPAEPAHEQTELEPAKLEPDESGEADHGGSSNSGPGSADSGGGSDNSGSGHSGSSGDDSQLDGSDG
jgi:RNA polymerase sigma-70 factor, ECF subfamily